MKSDNGVLPFPPPPVRCHLVLVIPHWWNRRQLEKTESSPCRSFIFGVLLRFVTSPNGYFRMSSRRKVPHKVDRSWSGSLREIHHQVGRVVVWHPADGAGDQGQSAVSRWACGLWNRFSFPADCQRLNNAACVRTAEPRGTLVMSPSAKKRAASCIMYIALCIMQGNSPRWLCEHVKSCRGAVCLSYTFIRPL